MLTIKPVKQKLKDSLYDNNIDYIFGKKINQYPNLRRYLRYPKIVLECMLLFFKTHDAISRDRRRPCRDNIDLVFWISEDYLARYIVEKTKKRSMDKGTVNRYVNELVLVGLVNKINDDEISLHYPVAFRIRTWIWNYQKSYRQYNLINCYRIPLYTPELMQEAETISKFCHETGMTAGTATKERIALYFGAEKAEEVYPDGRTFDFDNDSERQLLERIISTALSERGYIKKDEIIARAMQELSPKQKNWKANQNWIKNRIDLYRFIWERAGLCKLVKPTNAMKEEYGLTDSKYIFVKP